MFDIRSDSSINFIFHLFFEENLVCCLANGGNSAFLPSFRLPVFLSSFSHLFPGPPILPVFFFPRHGIFLHSSFPFLFLGHSTSLFLLSLPRVFPPFPLPSSQIGGGPALIHLIYKNSLAKESNEKWSSFVIGRAIKNLTPRPRI